MHFCVRCCSACDCFGDVFLMVVGTLDDCTHCDDQFATGGADRADEPDLDYMENDV